MSLGYAIRYYPVGLLAKAFTSLRSILDTLVETSTCKSGWYNRDRAKGTTNMTYNVDNMKMRGMSIPHPAIHLAEAIWTTAKVLLILQASKFIWLHSANEKLIYGTLGIALIGVIYQVTKI